MTPEPTDKLDAATMVVVNGPADDPLEVGADRTTSPHRTYTGLLEPDAVKVASPVLRGAGRSNASGLPGEEPKPPTDASSSGAPRGWECRSGVEGLAAAERQAPAEHVPRPG